MPDETPKPAHRLAATRRFLLAEDVDLIQSVVPREGTPTVVDLGSGSGTTALAVLDVNPDAIIVSIDSDVANRDWAEANVDAHYPDANVTWMVGKASDPWADLGGWDIARETMDLFGTGPHANVDLLLHDAGHSYEDVHGDLSAWLPLLKPGTPVWIHDASPPPPDWGSKDESAGVTRAIMVLIGQGLLKGGTRAGLGWLGERA